jgi:serine phosphatase RsbU (regulator of sigma subunit)/anti-sigma regulatory factor (Ser/Thr protein kinase)
MPHGMCFLWQPNVLALHVISDALIALAYFSIPAVLLYLVRRRRDLPFNFAFVMFAAFIISCGTTHVLSIVVIWHPVYWVEGWVKAITAVTSIATAIMLVPLLPKALALRSPGDLDKLNKQLQKTLNERESLLQQFEREHFIATEYQNASLPHIPRRFGPLDIDAIYSPGVGELEVGGDWYDAFPLGDGRFVVSVGDVAGKGLSASIVMAKVRQSIRTVAHVISEPAGILSAVDRTLRSEYPDQIVTAFVGVIDNVEQTLAYASAGHPGPLLRTEDGAIVELSTGTLPLGLRLRDEDGSSHVVPLGPGSLLVMYTDGVTEATRDIAAGERQLREALEGAEAARATYPARAIRDATMPNAGHDDVAILTVRVNHPEELANRSERWKFVSDDAVQAQRVQRGVAANLERAGATPDYIATAQVILSELLGNIVRHAPGVVEVVLDQQVDRPVLHVLDRGRGFRFLARLPSDLLAESGRGLFMVDALAEEFHIVHRLDGGSHAIAVLRPVEVEARPTPEVAIRD